MIFKTGIRAIARGGPSTRELQQKTVQHDIFRNKQTEKKRQEHDKKQKTKHVNLGSVSAGCALTGHWNKNMQG